MAIIYVDSAATGSNNGTSWADAYTSIASTTGAAAGDFIYVASTHSQAFGANQDLNWSNGTQANPIKILSVNSATGAYTAAGALVSTLSGQLRLDGWFNSKGVNYSSAGNFGIGVVSGRSAKLENCTLTLTGTPTLFGSGNNNTVLLFDNCIINMAGFSSAGTKFQFGRNGTAIFRDCVLTPRTAGQSFFCWDTGYEARLVFEGCSLGSYSSAFIEGVLNNTIIKRCAWTSIPAWRNTTPTSAGASTLVQNSGVDGSITAPVLGMIHYQDAYGTAQASLTQFRTGGASDGEQVNEYSIAMTSGTNVIELYNAFDVTLGTRWVGPASSISGATARGLVTSYRCAPLATPAALTTDTVSTWNGSGVGIKQKIDHTLSNGQTLTVYVASGVTLEDDEFWIEVTEPDQVAGLVTVNAFLAKPSTTVYVCPKIEVA